MGRYTLKELYAYRYDSLTMKRFLAKVGPLSALEEICQEDPHDVPKAWSTKSTPELRSTQTSRLMAVSYAVFKTTQFSNLHEHRYQNSPHGAIVQQHGAPPYQPQRDLHTTLYPNKEEILKLLKSRLSPPIIAIRSTARHGKQVLNLT